MRRSGMVCGLKQLAVFASAVALTASSGLAAAAPGVGSPAAPPPACSWPGPGNTGVPAGWTPAATYDEDYVVDTPGAVIEDIRITNSELRIEAPNVTVRRVEVVNGAITNYCNANLTLENVSVVRSAGVPQDFGPAVQAGSYTAKRVKIDGLPEGFRAGAGDEGCTTITIEDSFVRVAHPDPANCAGIDWHGDGVQSYAGPAGVIRNTTLELVDSRECGGTAPLFWPNQAGNLRLDVDGLLVIGGGYPFRLETPGTVHNLMVKDNSWWFAPVDVDCSKVTSWQASIVTVDANYQPTVVRPLECG